MPRRVGPLHVAATDEKTLHDRSNNCVLHSSTPQTSSKSCQVQHPHSLGTNHNRKTACTHPSATDVVCVFPTLPPPRCYLNTHTGCIAYRLAKPKYFAAIVGPRKFPPWALVSRAPPTLRKFELLHVRLPARQSVGSTALGRRQFGFGVPRCQV